MKLSPQVVPVLLAVFSAVANAQDNDTEQEYCGYTAINGLVSGRNNQKCGPLLDDAFLPYNAMYTGSITLALTGNPSECPQNTYTMTNYIVGIGPQSIAGNSTFTRAGYDNNPFYLWMKYQEDKNISASFLSSSDYFVTESQWWTLNSTKNGNGFDIGGSYTGKLAAQGNVYNYPTDECWTVNIYNHIVKVETTSAKDYNYWTLTGRLEAEKIHIVIDQFWMWRGIEFHTIFTYDGVPNPTPQATARLVVTEDVPTTDLALKGVIVNTTATANETSDKAANGTKNSGVEDVVRGSITSAVIIGLVMVAGTFFL